MSYTVTASTTTGDRLSIGVIAKDPRDAKMRAWWLWERRGIAYEGKTTRTTCDTAGRAMCDCDACRLF